MKRLRASTLEDEAMKNVKNPQEYTYFRIIRINLLVLNAWPSQEIGEKTSKYRILINVGHFLLHTFLLIGGFMYIKSTPLDFYDLVKVYLVYFMLVLVMSRIIVLSLSSKFKTVFSVLLTRMHLFYYKNLSIYAMKIHKRVHYISHIFTIYITVQMLCVGIFLHAVPMATNYFSGKYHQKISENVTYELAFYYSFPYSTTTTLPGYIFAVVLNCCESLFMSIWFCQIDLALSLIVFNIWGHFNILIHELNSFPLPAKRKYLSVQSCTCEMFSQEELKAVSKKLEECFNYHRLIINFTKQVSSTFGIILFCYYIFYQVSLCLLLLECSQMTAEALTSHGPLTFIHFQQLIQLSMIVELIGTKSEQLKDAVYGVPWEYMDVKNRRTVAIFLMNLQRPIYIKALGLAQVGVATMAKIIKTSLSYFAFLHSSSK